MDGIIKQKIGNVMYKIVIEDKDMIWRQHTNQLKCNLGAWTIPNSVQPIQLNDSNPTNDKQLPTHSVHCEYPDLGHQAIIKLKGEKM